MSNDTMSNETLAEVLAEMESRETLDGSDMGVDNFRLEYGEYGGFDALPIFKAYAKRIREAIKHTPVGDAAKLRETLAWVDDCLKRRRVVSAHEIGALRTQIAAALNKPLRNCDLYGGDYKMLHTAWFDWTGSPSGQNPDGTVKLTFAEWLLAPANEKGEADGSK